MRRQQVVTIRKGKKVSFILRGKIKPLTVACVGSNEYLVVNVGKAKKCIFIFRKLKIGLLQ
jgi:hypothetical protein